MYIHNIVFNLLAFDCDLAPKFNKNFSLKENEITERLKQGIPTTTLLNQ